MMLYHIEVESVQVEMKSFQIEMISFHKIAVKIQTVFYLPIFF